MTGMDIVFLSAIMATFFLAGIVKGVTGMGLPTVAMGVLGLIMPPVVAAGLLLLPSFVTNIWQLFSGPDFRDILGRLWSMMIAIIIGTLIGVQLIAGGATQWTTAALGAALFIYAAYSLVARPLLVPPHMTTFLSPFIGLITGLLTGATGVFVFPAVPYIQSLGLNRDMLVQALGLSFTISTVALAVGLAAHSAVEMWDLGLSALAIVPALLGMWAGQSIRKIVSPATFRRWFLICLMILGGELFLRPFWS